MEKLRELAETTTLMSSPATIAEGVHRKYQRMKPITSKNIGKKQRHIYEAPRADPQTKAADRRLKQQAKIQAKKLAKEKRQLNEAL